MENALFHGEQVSSSRIIYTPSAFAKECLTHIQEIGELKAQKQHISKRENLNSFLFIIVEAGSGTLIYEENEYSLSAGDCVFINCKKPYSHETSKDLWSLKWIHFYGPTVAGIYDKYTSRGGKPSFSPQDLASYTSLWESLYQTASSTDHVRDMKINEGISRLLTMIMSSTYDANQSLTNKQTTLEEIKSYIDNSFTEKITLDSLAQRYYINKFYLSHIFKETYETTVNNYVLTRRLTLAKHLLRFTESPLEDIGQKTGIGNIYYFSRIFKKIEGITPSEYRKQWKG